MVARSKEATSPYDMKRLEADTNNLVDFHFIWLVLSNHNYLVWSHLDLGKGCSSFSTGTILVYGLVRFYTWCL
jgi:hypothetical protein